MGRVANNIYFLSGSNIQHGNVVEQDYNGPLKKDQSSGKFTVIAIGYVNNLKEPLDFYIRYESELGSFFEQKIWVDRKIARIQEPSEFRSPII